MRDKTKTGWVKSVLPFISVVIAVVGVAVAWGARDERVSTLCRQIANHENRLAAVEKTAGGIEVCGKQLADHEIRLRVVEEKMTRIDERTARMERDIIEIKEAVR